MKIALLADVHLGDKRFSKFKNNKYHKIEYQKQSMLEFQEYVLGNNIPYVFITGDLLHSKILIIEYINFIIDWLNKFEEKNVKVYIIPGNHEAGSDYFSLDFLKEINYNNVFYFDYPKVVQIENYSFLFFPYLNSKLKNDYKVDNEQMLLRLMIAEKHEKVFIIAHAHDNGVKIRNQELSDIGIRFECIDCCLFISGHIHEYQEYKKNDIDFLYVGALNHLDFGDDPNTHRGFLILDILDETNYNVEKVKLKNEIKFYTFGFHVNFDEKILHELNKTIKENDYLKIRYGDQEINKKEIEKQLICKNIFWQFLGSNHVTKIILDKEITSLSLINELIEESDFSIRRKKQLKCIVDKIVKGVEV